MTIFNHLLDFLQHWYLITILWTQEREREGGRERERESERDGGREPGKIEGAISSTCYTPTHCSWCWENVLYFSKEVREPVMEHSTCPLLSEIPVKQSGQWSTKLRTMCVSHSCRLTERSLVLVPHHSGRQDCSDTSHEYCTDTHSWIVQMAERERLWLQCAMQWYVTYTSVLSTVIVCTLLYWFKWSLK